MLSFILTFHSFVPTRTRVWSACTCSVSLSRGIKGTALHRCSAFMDLSGTSQAALFLLRGREWLRQSVSVENLHGNKSHNLSQVCTLDWLRAITLTKKSIFFFSSPLPPPCLLPSSQPRVKLILWTFLKIFVYSLFSACECHPHPPCLLCLALRRGDCLLIETAVKNSQCLQCAFSPLCSTWPPHLPTPFPERVREQRRGLIFSPWDPHRCWVMGGWEGVGGGPTGGSGRQGWVGVGGGGVRAD